MKFLSNLWLFFNGKKTIIGSFLITLSVIMQELIINIFEYDAPWEHKVIKALNYIGGLLTTAGLIHKYEKAQEPK